MTEEEEKFFDSCWTARKYNDIDEYKADIQRWLVLSDWHYSQEEAVELTEDPNRASWIEVAFLTGESVADIAANGGYFCG